MERASSQNPALGAALGVAAFPGRGVARVDSLVRDFEPQPPGALTPMAGTSASEGARRRVPDRSGARRPQRSSATAASDMVRVDQLAPSLHDAAESATSTTTSHGALPAVPAMPRGGQPGPPTRRRGSHPHTPATSASGRRVNTENWHAIGDGDPRPLCPAKPGNRRPTGGASPSIGPHSVSDACRREVGRGACCMLRLSRVISTLGRRLLPRVGRRAS